MVMVRLTCARASSGNPSAARPASVARRVSMGASSGGIVTGNSDCPAAPALKRTAATPNVPAAAGVEVTTQPLGCALPAAGGDHGRPYLSRDRDRRHVAERDRRRDQVGTWARPLDAAEFALV